MRREVFPFAPVASVAAKLVFYGALMYAFLMTFAAIDHFLFGDSWDGWSRLTAYVAAFALPAFLLALYFGAWWVGFLAGLSFFVVALMAILLTADWQTFYQSHLPRGIWRWLGWLLVSPFLSPVWGALAGSLLRRLAFKPL